MTRDISMIASARRAEIGCAAPRACSTCPWRVDVQENPPEGFTRLEGDEGPRTRRALWEGGVHTIDALFQGFRRGVKDGNAVVCHQSDAVLNKVKDGARPFFCAPSIALRQRSVLRWCFGGTRDPLTFQGALATIAEMVGVDPDEIDVGGGWIANGEKITPSRLVGFAHPLVFDPNIASEGVPPPTAAELQQWGAAGEAALSP